MDKLSIIGLESDKDKLLRDLMDQGTVELIDQSDRLQQEDWAAIVQKDGEEDRVSRVESQLSEVQTALDAIERYDTSKKPLFNTRKAVSQSAYDTKLSGSEHIRSEVSRILDLHNQWNDLKSEENGIVSDQASLKPWATYELPLDQIGTRYVRIMCGILPIVANVQEMEQKIEAVSEATQVTILSSDMEQLYISVLCMRADEEAIVDVMKSYGFTMASFKDMKGTVKENAERLTRRLAEVQGEEKNLEQKLAEAVSTKEDLQYYYDSLILERDKAKASENFLKTGKAFQMEGWMVADARKDIEKVVEENGCICEITEPAKDEQTPILLKNNSLVTPFEAITSMYALPRSYEIDPTPFFAFFYFVFFGMMFADMGYGAVLAIACFAVLKCFDLEGTSYRLIKTMAFCGISTFLWGALFGGFLGDFVSVVSETFFGHRITITPLWFDPLSDPMKLLVFSCVLGTVHLFVGMGIKAYMQIRDGKLVDAIQEVFAWYLLIVGAALFLFGSSLFAGAVTIGKYMAIVGAVIIVGFPMVRSKGIGKLLGLWDLYGATSYLADILSYSRLLALGLASAVIAQVFNKLGSLFGGLPVVLAVILFLLIAAIGHVLNFAINALGAYVHASRLQYVEFFGKFYEGGGDEFQPFAKNTKYMKIVKEEK